MYIWSMCLFHFELEVITNPKLLEVCDLYMHVHAEKCLCQKMPKAFRLHCIIWDLDV